MNQTTDSKDKGGEWATKTPRTNGALKATQGLFRAAAETNGFADHARALESSLTTALARAERAEKALATTTDELATLIKGEFDDPSVGIVGWNSLHRLVEENRALLKPPTDPQSEKKGGA